PAGRLTIGVGRNLEDLGITTDEAMFLLANDVERCCAELDLAVPWWRTLDDVRQRVLVNMVFNLGIRRFLGFKKMLRHAAAQAWDLAADEMLDSRWAVQVGMRAKTLSDMMRSGQD
ncbi:MAG: glycoside hydrolase family protein, partial [Alphaproteobacteria bacterium]